MKYRKTSRTSALLGYLAKFISSYTDAPPSPLPYGNPWRLLRYSGPLERVYRGYLSKNKKNLGRDLNRLRHHGMLKYTRIGPNIRIEITAKGKGLLGWAGFESMKLKTGGKWDGRWRIVVFDIPESKRPSRDALRAKLKQLGFTQIQRSVWAFPYECQKELGIVCDVYEIRPFVTMLEGKYLGNDSRLRKIYSL